MLKKLAAASCILFLFLPASFSEDAAGKIYVKKTGNGKISFRLKDADIRTVLQIFGKQMGVNIVAGEAIKGKVTMSFSGVLPQEGLDSVLRISGYNWYREGDTIIVTTNKMVKTFTLQFANAEEVQDSIKPLLGSDDSVSINKSYNQIIVKAGSDRMGSIIKAIQDVDVAQTQVVVEANIVEVKRSDDGTIGVDLKGIGRNTNNVVQTLNFAGRPASGTSSLYAQVISNNFEAYLSAVLEQDNYSVLASPRITTINHKEASILIGEKIGYQTYLTTTTGTSTSINFLETGTKLSMTPHVSDNGYIRMVIAPKVSEGTVDQTTGIPNENTTETKNEVLVKDGQTIVIGGLIKKKELQIESGIPILMNIPFIGMAFKRNTIANENRELIIFIKPHIMTPEYLNTMDGQIKSILKGKEEAARKSTIIN